MQGGYSSSSVLSNLFYRRSCYPLVFLAFPIPCPKDTSPNHARLVNDTYGTFNAHSEEKKPKAVSPSRGTQYRPPNAITLYMGISKMVSLSLHMACRFGFVQRYVARHGPSAQLKGSNVPRNTPLHSSKAATCYLNNSALRIPSSTSTAAASEQVS